LDEGIAPYFGIVWGLASSQSRRLRLPHPSRFSKGGYHVRWYRAWWKMPRPSRGLQAVVTKEREVEAGAAHLSKITKGGAVSVIYGAAQQSKVGQPPSSARFVRCSLTSPIPITDAHPLIPVLSYSYPLPIMPGEERQNNWTKVLRDTLVSFATSCPIKPLSVNNNRAP
jgi:hypothetical protein